MSRSSPKRSRQSSAFLDDVFAQVGRVVVGQRDMVERIMIGLLTGGHCLIEGVPGLAKTLTVKTLAQTIHASVPADPVHPGSAARRHHRHDHLQHAHGQFTQKRGPLFANLVLADEVNRAPAKVQSALLEAMQERQVTIGDTTHRLPDPFLVLATQNPIEQEGTFPLPEAQLDRFMLLIKVGYPTAADERAMLDRMSSARDARGDRGHHDRAGAGRAPRRQLDLHRRPRARLHRAHRAGDAAGRATTASASSRR